MVKNVLVNKLFRDILHSRGQFLSIIILSALGIWVFSGLDSAWRNIDLSVKRYFEEQKLADFWVIAPNADGDMMSSIARISGVAEVQGRFSSEVKAKLPESPKLMLHATDGGTRINIPRIKNGGLLSENDLQGCLLDEQFAKAHDLLPGDSLTIELAGTEFSFKVRGLVISPEYVFTAKYIIPEPESYGYVYTNIASFAGLPINEVCVRLSDSGSSRAVKNEIEEKLPNVFVRDRNTHKSTEMISSEIEQYRSLSGIFPILFFAVAVLIVLTTMTRMVENQRIQLGILKAVGYSREKIMRHYLLYGFLPSLFGSAAGLLLGPYTLSRFLWGVMLDMYVLPEMMSAPISSAALIVCILSVLLTCLICYLACRRNIAETSAALLHPKAPKAGSRIILERISVVWLSLTFNAKMILRNLFRNRMRTIMALMGVLGCTALIITAFGLNDSIGNLLNTYFGGTLRYDIRAELDNKNVTVGEYRKNITAETVEGIMEMAVSIVNDRNLPQDKAVNNSRLVLLTIYEDGQKLIAPQNGSAVHGLEGGLLLANPEGKALMTEKLAEAMGMKTGDTLLVKIPGITKTIRVTIGQLLPVQMGQGVYLSRSTWESFGIGDFIPSTLLVENAGENCMNLMEGMEGVISVKSLSSIKEKTVSGLKGINSISMLMTIFALVLAFVVLYNMGVLNFIERTREFATLKVLGYRQKETRSLIIFENALVTIVGIAAGILPGLQLTKIVMQSCEPDDMMFVPYNSLLSICMACGITFAFSMLIQLFLTRMVRSIDMVEALKSVD